MKKQLALATAALMALSLAACGNTATASSAAESTAESTSTAASSEAASTDSTAADDGDVLQQAAAAAFANDVTLTMWGAEEDQELLRTIADNLSKNTAITAARSPSTWALSPSPQPRIPS